MIADPKAWLISREAAENNLKRVEDEEDAFESLYEEAATHTIVALYAQLEAQAAVVATAKAWKDYITADGADIYAEDRQLIKAVRALEEAEANGSS